MYLISFSRKVSIAGNVLQQYQSMIEDANLYLNDQMESPIIADFLPRELPNTQNVTLALEKRSIEQCLQICDRALEFTKTSNFQADKGQPTVISTINELLPQEQRGSTMVLDRIRQLSIP
ncbi:hypothetical protein AJ80_09998 [Polytolypa hystricis UAMH7299]|uniref:Uncharacterized protein n=1 Tax=Polytolypa hystricis (strain UAMH7299) TaxID=1447883 RepID=A0A2B7WF81_POLH7|nr:hypothetical protein AJ80_09998 [Polytolypa hystricis UAMH7299]